MWNWFHTFIYHWGHMSSMYTVGAQWLIGRGLWFPETWCYRFILSYRRENYHKKKLFAWKYTSSLAILKGIFPWFLVFNFLFITSSSYDKCILRWRVLHENKKESLSQNIGLVSWQQYSVAAIIISLGKKERNKKPFVKEKGENGARTSDINSNTAYPHTRACFSLLAITSHTAHHLLLCFPHFIPYTHCVHLFYSQLSCLSLSTSCHQNCLYFMLWSPAIHNSTTSHLKCHFCSLFVCFSVMACLGFTSLWNT